jgi:hypothetical protein
MVKVMVQVTQKELDNLEDLVTAWNLCDKHKAVYNASEEELFGFTQNCRACIKINKEVRGISLHLWSKLVTAYLKTKAANTYSLK